jgi:hypothetical protein
VCGQCYGGDQAYVLRKLHGKEKGKPKPRHKTVNIVLFTGWLLKGHSHFLAVKKYCYKKALKAKTGPVKNR